MKKYRKTDILMLLNNSFQPDPRVLHEAKSLIKKYDVTVCAVDHEGIYPKNEMVEGVHIHRLGPSFYRVFRRKIIEAHVYVTQTESGANYEEINITKKSSKKCGFINLKKFKISFFRILRDIFKFLQVASFLERISFYLIGLELLQYSFKVVHCHDLDTLLLGVVLGKLKRAKIVFDAHEDYASMIGFYKGYKTAKRLLILEKILMKYVDAVIVVGTIMENEYKKRTNKPIYVVGNWKNPKDFWERKDKIHPRAIEAKKNGKLIISYLSGIGQSRIILPLLEAAAKDKDVFILVAGGRPDNQLVTKIEKEMATLPNGLFLGWLSQEELNAYFAFTDVVYYCLSPKDENNRLSVSNSLFSALAAGKAMITTQIGEMGMIADKGECGVVMPEASKENILSAFEKLKDHNKLKRFQGNAVKMSKLYSWDHAEKTLLYLYKDMLATRCARRQRPS